MRKAQTPALDEAIEFLRQFPAGHTMPASDVDHLLEVELDCGYITLMKAKKKLGIRSERDGYKWVWVWPTDGGGRAREH